MDNRQTTPLKIVRRNKDGRVLTRAELRAMEVATPAVENAVRQAAKRMDAGSVTG